MSLPTGGTITTSGLYNIHTFTSSGTFTVPYFKPGKTMRILIVGAGATGQSGLGSSAACGAGWRVAGAGGSGGGFRDTDITPTFGDNTITVGVGGATGGDSSAFDLISAGGSRTFSGDPTTFAGGGIAVQWCSTRMRYKSGAGASAIGTDSAGGEGLASDITGTSVVYASGGGRGGQSSDSGQGTLSGAPGGTNAGYGSLGASTKQPVANTGSGGGGGAMFGDGGNDSGGTGADGIIVIKYLISDTQQLYGGMI